MNRRHFLRSLIGLPLLGAVPVSATSLTIRIEATNAEAIARAFKDNPVWLKNTLDKSGR